MGVVLIAEDEPPMLEICADIVEDLGHRTLRAHDGESRPLREPLQNPVCSCAIVPATHT